MAKKFGNVKAALSDALKAVLTPESMRKFGQQAADMIRLRTRLGDGVSGEGADKAPLKSLADATVRERERLAALGLLNENTTPTKSNLTRSGQLLDSLGVTNVTTGKATVGPTGDRDDGLSNEDVAVYVSEQGREFNHLSRVEIKRVTDAMKQELRAQISARLTTQRK